MEGANRYWYNKAEYKQKILSIKVTYPCCKFGFEYTFKHRDESITVWRSVQNVYSFDASIVTILWEEKVPKIRFAVLLYVYVCIYIYIYIYMA